MTTTVNQKVANPNFPTGGASGTTGTGNLVFSESPTINNPTLTGSVSANVNLRSGTMATLLPLAGGVSEIGYATDANALVKFNGVAGGAEVLTGGATKVFTLNDANFLPYATPGSGVFIDCANVSTLVLNYAFLDPEFGVDSLNIKLPDSRKNPELTVIKTGSGLIFNGFLIYLGFQAGDPVSYYSGTDADLSLYNNTDNPIPGDGIFPAKINGSDASPFEVTFLAGPYGWSRLPRPWEAKTDTTNSNHPFSSGNVGEKISSGLSNVALTSGVVTNIGSVYVPYGYWLLNYSVTYKSTNATALNASEVMSAIVFTIGQTPSLGDRSTMQITNLANTNEVSQNGTFRMDFGNTNFYLNVKATIASGSVTATGFINLFRIL